MKIIDNNLTINISAEEIEVIRKMIGATSLTSRIDDFGLTESQTNIAERIYNDLSIIGGIK